MSTMDLDLLLPNDTDRDRLRWATVTDDSPLTIRLDGEDDPLPIPVDTVIAGLAVDDRVLIALVINDQAESKYRRAIVIGIGGGSDLAGDIAALDARVDDLEAVTCAEDVQNTSGTTTSTTYTSSLTGGTACSIVFVAPPSGDVLIHNGCNISNGSAAINTWCSFQVRTGSTPGAGSDVTSNSTADTDTRAIQHPGTSPCALGRSKMVTGLTPGDTYNVIQVFRVSSASTGTFDDKNLIVEGK